MVRKGAWPGAILSGVLVLSAGAIQAQGPAQFRSDLRVRDLDGKTGSATLMVGGARLRMEFPVDGETRPTIVDPKSGTQFTLSPGRKAYMEMPLGESGGVVRIPRLGPVNPSNPCSTDDYTDCKRLGAETVNGYATEKWEYSNVDGERVTAWVATKLRFPVRTRADNGASTDLSNVVEGPQSTALFDIPRGYTKVDDLDADTDDLAKALANVDPAMIQKAMEMARNMPGAAAAADRANEPPPPAASSRGGSARGTGWGSGPGYVVNVTITATGREEERTPGSNAFQQSNGTLRYVASLPLNAGFEGAPPVLGPQWSQLALPGSGTPEAEALPVTLDVDSRVETVTRVSRGCGIAGDESTTTMVVTQKGRMSSPLTQLAKQLGGTVIWKINPAQTAYSLTAQLVAVQAQAEQVTTMKRVDHCGGDGTTNDTQTAPVKLLSLAFEVPNAPLPTTPGAPIKGTQQIPWRNIPGTSTATLEWTITRVGAK